MFREEKTTYQQFAFKRFREALDVTEEERDLENTSKFKSNKMLTARESV